jgi:Uma2 family endonuclease
VSAVINKPPIPVRWSKDFYYQMAELGWFEGKRVELIDGEIYEMSPIGSRHAVAVTLTTRVLDRLNPEDYFAYSQNPLNSGKRSEPVPDVAVLTGTARDYTASLPTTAVLVVEVSDSSLKFDKTVKAALYASNGIQEYWILDVTTNTLIVHRQPAVSGGDGSVYQYDFVSRYNPSESISPLFSPDSIVTVASLLP